MARLAMRALRALQEALYPARCPGCRRFFVPLRASERWPAEAFRRRLATFVCPACAASYTALTSPLCTCCGARFAARTGDDHLCGACLATRRHFAMARAAGVYEHILVALIQRFKYHGALQLAVPLGQLLFDAFSHHWRQREVDLVVPVPLHARRHRRRGFNQAYLLVRHWPRLAAAVAPTPPLFEVDPRLLVRRRRTASQTGLGRRQRRQNVRDSFAVAAGKALERRRILLVDDVYTTGATVDECARTLLRAGAGRVDVLTLARAL